jgi:hypothetical protein
MSKRFLSVVSSIVFLLVTAIDCQVTDLPKIYGSCKLVNSCQSSGIQITSVDQLCFLIVIVVIALVIARVIYNHNRSQAQIVKQYNEDRNALDELKKKFYDFS